jgi:uncharacterized protein (TIGR03089 family)
MREVFEVLMADPGRPRVTWYGPDHERIELSGKTLLNWVSKTANLLTDELDAEPGTTVHVDLPAHWRTVSWLLATWAVGAHVVTRGPADITVTTEPEDAAGTVVAVALPALAVSFGPHLPPGAIDAAAAVRLQPDVFVPVLQPAGADPAFDDLAYGELVPAARSAATADRLLTGGGPEDALASLLGPLLHDGSVVVHHDLAGLGDEALARLVEQEGVTARR